MTALSADRLSLVSHSNLEGAELLGWRSDTRTYHLCIEKITATTYVLLLGHEREARQSTWTRSPARASADSTSVVYVRVRLLPQAHRRLAAAL